MQTSKLKIGVLGGANIAVRSVIPAILELPETFELAGIASRDAGKAKELAQKFSTGAYVGYESMLADPGIDAVYIPLPNGLHFDTVSEALKNGKHVLVEKSLACSEAEVEALVRLAEGEDLVLVENFQFRFHSQLGAIKDLVNSGELGELRSVRVSFGFPPFSAADNIRYNAKLGGGALLDAGAYPLKIATHFLGEDMEVSAASWSFDENRQVDIWGGGFLKQRSGPLFCQFSFGFDHFYQCALELWGTKGKLFTNRIFTAPPGYQPSLLIETAAGRREVLLPADHHFRNMLDYFYALCLTGKTAENENRQNRLQARLLQQFRDMAQL